MINFWWGLLVLVVFLIVTRSLEEMSWMPDTDGAITGMLALIAIVLLIQVAFTNTVVYGDEYVVEESAYSMRTTDAQESNISGAFMLGFGAISGSSKNTPAYYCYTGDDARGYILESFDANETRLIPSEAMKNAKVSRWYKDGVRYFKGNFLFGGLISIGGKYHMPQKLLRTTITLPSDYIQFKYDTITN